MNIKNIEQAVEKLNTDELGRFREWFSEYDWQSWDSQIKRDSASGKLNKLAQKAYEDYLKGQTNKL